MGARGADDDVEFSGTERFQVLSRLGVGGMGEVYEVFDRQRRTRAALKRLRQPAPDTLIRFKKEFRALEELDHPNLVQIGELFEHAGAWFYTMELVDGEDFIAHVRPGSGPTSDELSSARTLDTRAGAPPPGQAAIAAVPAARAAAGFDEPRLRASLAQLASALATLHAAGKVHRDVKPANIRIARDARLALIDLGLVLDLGHDTMPALEVAGTADYMAPEQAAAGVVGPAADWYAVGVLLYQALTGILPFSGAPLAIISTKQRQEPPPPGELVHGVPEDLDRLCSALLRIDPAARPVDRDVVAALGATPPAPAASAPAATPFVGREAELARLASALDALASHGGVTVLVEGESGVGKSVLVQRFTERLSFTARSAGLAPLILAGRCHEREAVPYKALDGVIDALARALSRFRPAELPPLLPPSTGLLTHVFPVLRQLEPAARHAGSFVAPRETGERRDLLFRTLRELLARLARRGPLVLVIDDLQWGDADSLMLLRHLLAPPDAPRLLLLATVRTTAEAADALFGALALPGEVRRLPLAGLGAADAQALAGLLGGDGAAGERLAAEAHGHPLFMIELSRYAAAHPDAPRGAVRLEQALWSRVLKLDPQVRRLLELVAVAGAPLRQDVAARACDAPDATTFARWISMLRTSHLAKTTGAGDADLVEPYHDRVRAAVQLHIPDEARAICHRRIALALESVLGGPGGSADGGVARARSHPGAGAEAESLAVHWHGAGNRQHAALYATAAAGEAEGALAFDRAARLLRMAVDLSAPGAGERTALQARAADALVNAGRGREAADLYLEAAERAPPDAALELYRRAAEQYLRNGHMAEGTATLGHVLPAIGMRLAPTPARALVSLLGKRARVWLRGRRFEERAERDVPQAMLTRIDTCWSIAAGLAMVDTIRGADFQARQLLLALAAGEPFRVCRALAAEASFRAASGDAHAAAELIVEAGALADRHPDDPRARAFVLLCRGLSAYLDGRFHDSLPELQAAATHMAEHCTGLGWELYNARFYALLALLWTGELGEACRRIAVLRMEAATRGDRYASATLQNGMCVWHSLWLDDAEGGLQMARRVVEDLPAFQFQHYWEMVAGSYCHIYRGDGAAALALVDERWAPSAKSMFFRIPYIRVEALMLRGRARLAAAQRASTADRARLLALAGKDARKLAGEQLAFAHPLGLSIEAGRAHARGDTARALALHQQAGLKYADCHMELHRQSTEHAIGRLLGPDGDARRYAAEQWMQAQGVRAPAKLARAIVPGGGDD